MKKLLMLLLLIIHSTAFSNVCEDLFENVPSLDFNINYGTPNIYQIPENQLIQQTGRSKTVGLTEAKARMIYKVKTTVIWKDSIICVYPKEVFVEYGYPKLTIYINDKYEHESCQYKETLKHEQEHVDIFQGYLSKNANNMEALSKKVVHNLKPIQIQNDGEINKATNYFMYILDTNREILELRNKMQSDIDYQNSQLDKKESYKEVMQKCNNW